MDWKVVILDIHASMIKNEVLRHGRSKQLGRLGFDLISFTVQS